MKFSIICILLFVLTTCQFRYSSGSRYNQYEYYYPEEDSIETEQENSSSGNSLADYWKVFRESFQKSYQDLNKPYVVERQVPVYIPVDRVRTVVKHHPVYIKPKPNKPMFYRRRPPPPRHYGNYY